MKTLNINKTPNYYLIHNGRWKEEKTGGGGGWGVWVEYGGFVCVLSVWVYGWSVHGYKCVCMDV